MYSRRLDQNEYNCLSHTSSRRLQDVFKTSSRGLVKMPARILQDIFKESRTHFEKVLKTFLRQLQDVLDDFKMYHQVKLFLQTRLQDVFKASKASRRFQRINKYIKVQNIRINVSLKMYFAGFRFSIYTPFSNCLQRDIQNPLDYLRRNFFRKNS